jgi:hypothetical protein
MADDVIVINNPPDRRESKSGKVRYTVTVKSEPLVHSFDPKTLGAPVAHAIAEALRKKVTAIGAGISAATERARAGYLAGFTRGTRSAAKRYSGGRIGSMPPAQSDRAFNDSGRFAKSLTANARGDAWTVNVAANRLDPDTAGGDIAVRKIWNRLVELVPAFGNPVMLFDEQSVRDSINESIGQLIVKAKATRDQLSEARAKAIVNVAKQAMGVLLRAVG